MYAALAVHTLRIEAPALAALAFLATVDLLERSNCRGENSTAGVLLRGCPPKVCSLDSSELGHGERSLGTPSLPLPPLLDFAQGLGLDATSWASVTFRHTLSGRSGGFDLGRRSELASSELASSDACCAACCSATAPNGLLLGGAVRQRGRSSRSGRSGGTAVAVSGSCQMGPGSSRKAQCMARLGVTQSPPAGSSCRPRIEEDHIFDGLEGGLRAHRSDGGVDDRDPSTVEAGKQGSGDWSGDKQLISSGKEDRTVPLSCSAPLSRSGVRVSGADRLRRRRSGAGMTTARPRSWRANIDVRCGLLTSMKRHTKPAAAGFRKYIGNGSHRSGFADFAE